MQVSYREFHPFIRKVGIAGNIFQNAVKIALDYRLICVQEGFGSLRQLTDSFKKSYGMTPSAYRKRKEVSFALI